MVTIEEKLLKNDNDYSHIEYQFSKKGITFIEKIDDDGTSISSSISVIIPSYNLPYLLQLTLDSLNSQKGIEEVFFEVLIIDDNSDIESFENIHIPSGLNVRLFRNRDNFGSGISRNIGLYHSTGDISLFLDSDIVPSKYLLREHIVRHQLFNNFFLLGFKENVELDDFDDWNVREPDPKKDPRFYKETVKYGMKDRKISLYLDTNKFKEFQAIK